MNIFEMLNEPYHLPKKVKLFEAFSGIGCQRMGFEKANIDYEVVGISEIDKYALQSYMSIHGETKNFGSITDIKGKDLPHIDVFTWSFPCTDLSKAGKQAGMSVGTRSGLVYEVLRILHEAKEHDTLPKVLIMENVVDLIQSKFIRQFQEVQLELEEIGYTNYVETMNAKDYGVAQNRDRVFMVSILGDYYYEFPKPIKLNKRLKDYLEDKVDEKYYISEAMMGYLTDKTDRNGFVRGDRFRPLDLEASYGMAITTHAGSRPTDNFIKEPKVVYIPEATTKGYAEAYDGDGVYLNRPHQKRGVVQNQMIQTLKTSGTDVGVVVHNIVQNVKVRKNEIDLIKLKDLLRKSKNLSIIEISKKLNKPKTLVEHWFRNDESFAIPSSDIWFELKKLLNIKTNEFDKQIMEFEIKENVYEKSNRVYDEKGISPTLTCVSANEKIVNDLRIRKLTPLECWRLMGINDEYFNKASQVCSNAQLYKQAGNGIVVDVFAYIVGAMK